MLTAHHYRREQVMPGLNDPRRPLEVTQSLAPSASSDLDETVGAPSTAHPPAATGFGPPAESGEVGTLGPYRVVRHLGRGGMGAVYAALDTRLNRRLVLKVMLPEFAAKAAAKERFLREARAAAQVTHDNVVTVYEADERDGVPYIAMQFLEGYPLDEYLKKKGNLPIPQILRIAREVAAGLSAAHKIGLIHRDIKPGNLWLEAPQGRIKILDFGLVKPVDAEVELTKSGAIVGTPAYMSPEQARGEKVDHRTDLFSLGAVLYRLCTGRLPFHGPNTVAVLMALGTEEPPLVQELNPAVHEPLAELIHQLLAKKPADRPQTADEVARRIRAMVSQPPGSAVPMTAPAQSAVTSPAPAVGQVGYAPIHVTAQPEPNPWRDIDVTEAEPAAVPQQMKPSRKGWWIAVGAAALAALIAGGVIIIIRNKDGTETKIEVPAGASVTVKGKDGKTLAQVGPGGKQLVADASPDRKAAEWGLSIGAEIRVNGEKTAVQKTKGLPQVPFRLTFADFPENDRVTDEGLANFKNCESLLRLNLFNTKASDAGMPHFKDCKGLEYLGLRGTQVGDKGVANFKGCKDITFLDLSDSRVTDAGLTHFEDCQNLKYLQLVNLRVTDKGLANFKGCEDLIWLILTGTRVSDVGLADFKGCEKLRILTLQRTKVTAKGVADLAKALPQCRIEWDGGVIESKK
jgi:serine/threonine protein kinase